MHDNIDTTGHATLVLWLVLAVAWLISEYERRKRQR